MRIFNIISILLISIVLVSCTLSEECREDKDVYMQMGFYTKTLNTKTGLYVNSALAIDSLWVNGLGVDSFLFENSKKINSIDVPLKKLSTQTDFIVRFNQKTDTISIFYQNNDRYFISLECGCVIAHSIDEVTSTNHFIDSISVINRDITPTNAEHIQIYHF